MSKPRPSVLNGGPTKGLVRWRYPNIYPTNSRHIVYVPTNGIGIDGFTFEVTDGTATSAAAVCSLVIVTNTAPAARAMAGSTKHR